MSFVEDRAVQRQMAWERSREVRAKRRVLREAMKARRVDPYRIIRGEAEPAIEELVQQMKLRQLLPYVPGVGKARTVEIIHAFDASPETKIGRLSPERRRDLSLIVKGACEA